MKAMILAAGRGERMGVLTKDIPKPLIKVGKKPIIEHKIKYYNNQGIEKIIFCLGYKSKQLKNFLIKNLAYSLIFISLPGPIFINVSLIFLFIKKIQASATSST